MLKALPSFTWPMLAWGLALIVALDAGYYGLALRAWLWEHTGDSLRFPFDIGNGWQRGLDVYRLAEQIEHRRHPSFRIPRRGIVKLSWRQWLDGFLADYDHTVTIHEEGDYGLDYSPVRLLIMSGWVKYTLDHHPHITQWNDDVARPLLQMNSACEMIAAISAGLLAWLWSRRAAGHAKCRIANSKSQIRRNTVPVFLGLIAYLLLWFNPAILLEAHVWPQWDCWIIAAYLLAALLLSLRWPLTAGLVIALGAMMKGQMLLAAPLLIFWPLFAGKWWTALRVVLGIAFAVALLASPWLLVDIQLVWLIAGAAGLVLLVLVPLPIFVRPLRKPLLLARIAGLIAIATITIGVIFCAWYFDGSMSWYKVGFEYGTRHFPVMNIGSGMNLPRVLHDAYYWQPHNPAGVLMLGRDRPLQPAPKTAPLLAADNTWWPLDLRAALILIYIVCLVICSIAAAIHDRRRDARILIAIAAPWVLFFALLAQMHERYLIWACGVTALAAGVSLGMTLLHLLVTFLSMLMILPGLLNSHIWNTLAEGWPKYWPEILTTHLPLPQTLLEYINAATPGLGWVTLAVAMTYLVYSCGATGRGNSLSA